MFDRRKCEHPLEIPDLDQEQRSNADRDEPKADEPRSRIKAWRDTDHGKETQDDIEHCRRLDAGQQRADRRRGLTVRVRQPRVHRDEADLGSEAHKDEEKRWP